MKNYIFCDGGAKGTTITKGVGGWGVYVDSTKGKFKVSGGEKVATNNLMEVTAMTRALQKVIELDLSNVLIISDSAYTLNCIKDKWYIGWKANGWKNSKKEPVANQEAWEEMLVALEEVQQGFRGVEFAHINSHIPKSGLGKAHVKFNTKNNQNLDFEEFLRLVEGNEIVDGLATSSMEGIETLSKEDFPTILSTLDKKKLTKDTIVMIMGETATGKSTTIEELKNMGYFAPTSDTTRPMREGEKEGIDYYFRTPEEFISCDSYIEKATVNSGWCYGYRKEFLQEGINILAINPTGYDQVIDFAEKNNYDVKVILLKLHWRERVKRLLDRGDQLGEIYRRVINDEGQFKPLKTRMELGIGRHLPTEIEVGNKSPSEIAKEIKKVIDF